MTRKKHKRGDRGSTEEETNVAKRQNNKPNAHEEDNENMADRKESDHAASEEQPTLYKIRNMLADLQKLVTSILKENSTLREDIKQSKMCLQSKEREVSVLKIDKNIIGKGVKS